MSNPLLRLVSPGTWSRHHSPETPVEPIRVTARNAWHRQSSVVGDGFTVQALRCGDRRIPGRIQVKPIPLVGAGAGVMDPGDAEPEAAQSPARAVLRFEFQRPSLIHNLDLGLLFDGPEYADWEEAVRVEVLFAGDATPQRCTLYASFVNAGYASCSWDGSAVPWVSSGAWGGGPGLWLNTDPFGGRAVTRLDLHAPHADGSGEPDPLSPLARRSDYVFRSLDASASADVTQRTSGDLTIGAVDSVKHAATPRRARVP